MKKLAILLFVLVLAMPLFAFKGYVGEVVSVDISSYETSLEILGHSYESDLDAISVIDSIKGGHFFGQSGTHGILYSFGFGLLPSFEADGHDISDVFEGLYSESLMYGYKKELSSKDTLVLGAGLGLTNYIGDEHTSDLTAVYVASTISGFHNFGRHFALQYGCDLDYTIFGDWEPEYDDFELTGFSFVPYVGFHFVY